MKKKNVLKLRAALSEAIADRENFAEQICSKLDASSKRAEEWRDLSVRNAEEVKRVSKLAGEWQKEAGRYAENADYWRKAANKLTKELEEAKRQGSNLELERKYFQDLAKHNAKEVARASKLALEWQQEADRFAREAEEARQELDSRVREVHDTAPHDGPEDNYDYGFETTWCEEELAKDGLAPTKYLDAIDEAVEALAEATGTPMPVVQKQPCCGTTAPHLPHSGPNCVCVGTCNC